MIQPKLKDAPWLMTCYGVPLIIFTAGLTAALMYAEGAMMIAGVVAAAIGLALVITALILEKPIVSLFGTAVVMSMGMAAVGVVDPGTAVAPGLIAAGGLGLVLTLLAIPLWNALGGPSAAGAGTLPGAADSRELLSLLRDVHTHTMLSDNAKRVLFRDRELQMLREVIEQDLARGEYNAGIKLCDAMADLFGYREEAEQFRSRILRAREEHFEAQVVAALEELDHHLLRRDWAAAHREAARIRRLYPDSHHAADLDRRILRAREEHRRDLEQRFLDASDQERYDEAMTLLRELDRYLRPEEAERLRPTAQTVISRYREHLGEQFKHAVQSHDWDIAVHIGERIMSEFPNAKMATEVREIMGTLRQRASSSPPQSTSVMA